METYLFMNWNGDSCKTEADPLRPETLPYPRAEIKEVFLDCTKLFLEVQTPIPNRHETEKLRELLDCIAVRYKEKLPFDFALSKMGMGKTRFCKFFQSRTGMSYVDYINKVRIEQAVRMLVETDWTVESIAYDCGFDTLSNFYKYFKKRQGVSPRKFRQRVECKE